MLSCYPWQAKQWQSLQALRESNRLAHAILLTGQEGIGLGQFVYSFAASLLCQQPASNGQACGECKSCLLYQADTHPDIVKLSPEEKGKQIKIDAIRELIDYIHLSSQYGKAKLAVIEPAEAMNRSSANSLLKTLEEPPPGSIIFLLAHQPALLPVTIRSRCQKVVMPPAGDEQMLAWLAEQPGVDSAQTGKLVELAEGLPLKALELLQSETLAQRQIILEDLIQLKNGQLDPVETAEKWQGFGISEVLQCLLRFFYSMTRLKIMNMPVSGDNSNTNRQLQELTKRLDLTQLFACYTLILQDYHAVNGPISLNKLGLLEDIIVHWQSLDERGGK